MGNDVITYTLHRDANEGIFGMDVSQGEIVWTIPGLPAYRAGILPRDKVCYLDGQPYTNTHEMVYKLSFQDIAVISVLPCETRYVCPALSWTRVKLISRHDNRVQARTVRVQSLGKEGYLTKWRSKWQKVPVNRIPEKTTMTYI